MQHCMLALRNQIEEKTLQDPVFGTKSELNIPELKKHETKKKTHKSLTR